MGRKNNREEKNSYQTDKQRERELDKLRQELIKPKKPYYERKKNYNKKKFEDNQK